MANKQKVYEANFPLRDKAAEKRAVEKLQYVANQIPDLPKALKFITDVIDQIQEDQQSKELLRSLVQDEISIGKWLLEANQMFNPA